MSKHQSIAKLFESKRYSKKVIVDDCNISDFELRRSNATYTNLPDTSRNSF